jgi:hypothetical protein
VLLHRGAVSPPESLRGDAGGLAAVYGVEAAVTLAAGAGGGVRDIFRN